MTSLAAIGAQFLICSALILAHLVTLAAAITMTGIAIVGLTLRARRKRFRLSWDALGIIAVYVLSLVLLAREADDG